MSSRLSNSPPLPPRRADWVAVGAKELLAVADPISATLIEAKDARSVCGRTLKAFDGEIRADLALSYVDTAPVSIGGYQVEAVTCRGRFEPVAGYHRGNKSLQYLSTKSRIMLKFAQLGKTGIYAPIQATVGTKVGTVTIRARRLEAVAIGRLRRAAACGKVRANQMCRGVRGRMARATLIGFSAVAMWALLALLTDASGEVPPFLLSAITFAIGTVRRTGRRGWSRRRRERGRRFRGRSGWSALPACSATTSSTSPRCATRRRWRPA